MLDQNHELLAHADFLSSSSFKGNDAIGNESVFYEKFLLDDLDNYWDELKDRLTVSRMVSDSVIKGMVDAVVEESEEKIALKEAEIATLNEKLLSYRNNSSMGNMSALSEATLKWNCIEELDGLRFAAEEQIQKLKEDIHSIGISNYNDGLNSSSTDVGLCSTVPQVRTHERMMETLQIADTLDTTIESLFEKMDERFLIIKASVLEQQLEYEFGREISTIVIQGSVRSLHDEFLRKLYEQQSLISTSNMNWQQKITELSSMREDLDTLFRSLSSLELGPLLSHNSLDGPEERNTSKIKDNLSRKVSGNIHLTYSTQTEENGITSMNQSEDCRQPMLEVADSSQLKRLNKDEVISYYKTEMIKMRRQHDSALQEKTEELFKLKREFLREKGSSLFKKDKEFEVLKKKIPEVILKLDDILLEKQNVPFVQIDEDEFYSLKGKLDNLLSENQQLRDLLSEKRKEVKCLSSRVSDTASQMSLNSLVECNFLKQIKHLKGELDNVKIETRIQDELQGITLREAISEIRCAMEDVKVEAIIKQDIYSTVVRGFIGDVTLTINSSVLGYLTEKCSLKILLYEKERALSAVIEEDKKLKESIASLSTLMEEKEKSASETSSIIMQQKQQLDLLNQEINMLREQITKQEVSVSNSKMESESIQRRLEEALQQIHETEMEIKKSNEKFLVSSNAFVEAEKQIHEAEREIKILNEKLFTVSNALEDAEKQKVVLHGIIEDRDKELLSSTAKEKEQANQMKSIVTSVLELSKAHIDFENKLTKNIGRNETRYSFYFCVPLSAISTL